VPCGRLRMRIADLDDNSEGFLEERISKLTAEG
jgi:hypothetical protein